MTSAVYGLCDPTTGELKYIGVTQDPHTRLIQHISESKHSDGKKGAWIRELARENKKPELFIIEEVESANRMSSEKFWMGYFRGLGSLLTNYIPENVYYPRKKLVPIDIDLHKQLKSMALDDGVTLTSLVKEAIELVIIGRRN